MFEDKHGNNISWKILLDKKRRTHNAHRKKFNRLKRINRRIWYTHEFKMFLMKARIKLLRPKLKYIGYLES